MSDRWWILILLGFCLAGLGGAFSSVGVQVGVIFIYLGSVLVFVGLSNLRRLWKEGDEPADDSYAHQPG